MYDISLPVYPGMVTYPGNPETKIVTFKSIAAVARVSSEEG